jgi:thymidylate synthase
MTTFDPSAVKKSVLWPCHGIVVQFYVRNVKKDNKHNNKKLLDCIMYQRSADIIAGVPYNISSYGLLCFMICNVLNTINKDLGKLDVFSCGNLTLHFGDIHLYDEPTHLNAVEEHQKRCPKKLPTLKFKRELKSLDEFTYDDIILEEYDSHPLIKINMVA